MKLRYFKKMFRKSFIAIRVRFSKCIVWLNEHRQRKRLNFFKYCTSTWSSAIKHSTTRRAYSLINHKKKTLLSIFKDLINQCDRMRFNERAIIRIIRIDQKIFIDKKLKDWMRAQEINWNWSTKNISEQNEKSERFDELLIEKARCIKEHAKLSKDLYSKCYLVNRTSSSSLSWDSSLIFMQNLLKESIRNEIAHLKMLDCKAFSLLKEADAFKKNKKMKSRAFIEYLIKYDFINIFRVWNSEKDDVSDYRDVIFNETEFFDTYETVDLLKKEERKFYVTYRAISLQIFENSNEKQYDRISVRKHVLNSPKENVVPESMMKKGISSSIEASQLSMMKKRTSSSIEASQLSTFDDTSSSESASTSIFVAVEISKSHCRKETSDKEMIWLLEKINHWTKKITFLFEKKFFLFELIEIIEKAFRDWRCFTERVNIEKYQFSNKYC